MFAYFDILDPRLWEKCLLVRYPARLCWDIVSSQVIASLIVLGTLPYEQFTILMIAGDSEIIKDTLSLHLWFSNSATAVITKSSKSISFTST